MKQIIVNVSGLSVEEKQRVNEALAKIAGVRVCNPPRWGAVATMYSPSFDGANVGWDYNRIHTPQQVLEMAGMAVKRKVRADFDPKQPISVDVSGCTEDEKKEVQKAFFDVGIKWKNGCETYKHLGKSQYSNTYECGEVSSFLMMSSDVSDCNMTPTEFLELVYEPEQQGHIHAENMALYAEDAKTTDKPWELWQFRTDGDWLDCSHHPYWNSTAEFRRKPKTHIVHGVEVPDLRFVPKKGDRYYLVDPTEREFTFNYAASSDSCDTVWAERGLCYEPTEEGKQAAILHAKAWLGIA